jgi:hypothetical protein
LASVIDPFARGAVSRATGGVVLAAFISFSSFSPHLLCASIG